MRKTITISLPAEISDVLDKTARSDGVSRSDLVRESLRDYLFIRQFRKVRHTMLPHAAKQGVFTDADVFSRVS